MDYSFVHATITIQHYWSMKIVNRSSTASAPAVIEPGPALPLLVLMRLVARRLSGPAFVRKSDCCVGARGDFVRMFSKEFDAAGHAGFGCTCRLRGRTDAMLWLASGAGP
jgi:hypothetical protein